MMNLLRETLEDLEMFGYTENNIVSVGIRGKGIIPNRKYLFNVNYDDGFGSQEVHPELVIKLDDGSWMERHEYDGSECWSLKCSPEIPNEVYQGRLVIRGWDDDYESLD